MDWTLVYNVITIPVVNAFVGWITTYLAILMIFRPREPKKILGCTIQGIVPKKRHMIAMSIGRSVERNMINMDDFQELIDKVDLEREVGKIVDKYVDEKFAHASEKSFVGRSYNAALGAIKAQTKAYLTTEIQKNANAVIKSFVDRLETEFDVQAIVAEKINGFDLETLEDVVFGFTKAEFKFLEIMGGVFGFVIGLAQAAILVVMHYT